MTKSYNILCLLLCTGFILGAQTAGDFYKQGRSSYQKQNYQEATGQFNKLTTQFPDDSRTDDAFYYLGRSYYALSEWDKALSSFEALSTLFPDSGYNVRTWYWIGRIYLKQKKSQEALVAFSRQASQDKDPRYQSMANYYLAKTRESLGYFRGARASYEAVLASQQTTLRPYVLYSLGRLALINDDPAQSMEYADKLIEEYGRSEHMGKAYALTGAVRYMEGDLDRAEKDLLFYLDQNLKDPYKEDIYYLLGRLYMDRKEDMKGMRYFNVLLEEYPDGQRMRDTLTAMIRMDLRDGQTSRAMSRFNDLLASQDDRQEYARLCYYLADILEEDMKDQISSLKYYLKASENASGKLKKDSLYKLVQISGSLYREADYDLYAEKLISGFPESEEALQTAMTQASAALVSDDTRKEEAALVFILKHPLLSDSVPYLRRLADIYYNSSRNEEAEQVSLTLLGLTSDDNEKSRLLLRLASLAYDKRADEKALDYYSRAAAYELNEEESLVTRYRQASLYWESGARELALPLIGELKNNSLATASMKSILNYYSAVYQLDRGNEEAALEDFKAVLLWDTDSEQADEAGHYLASWYFARKQWSFAIKHYEAFTSDPASDRYTESLYHSGQSWFFLKDYAKAAYFLQRALTAPDPVTRITAGEMLVFSYLYNGQFERAEEETRQYIQVTENDFALSDKWLAFSEQKRLDEDNDAALELYEIFMNLYPSGSRMASVQFRRAWVLNRQGRLKEASPILVKYLETYADHEDRSRVLSLLNDMIWNLKGEERKKLAVQIQNLNLQPAESAALRMTAARLFVNDYPLTVRSLIEPLVDIEDLAYRGDVYYYLGLSFHLRKEWDGALNWYSRLIENDNYYGLALMQSGICRQNNGSFAEAADLYRRAADSDSGKLPDTIPAALYYLYRISVFLENSEEADVALARLASDYPDSAWYNMAQ